MRNAGRPGGFEVREGLIRPGQDLVMAGFAGLAGTRIIGRERRADLEALFCPGFLELLDEPDTYDAERWFEGQEKNRDCPFTAYIPRGGGRRPSLPCGICPAATRRASQRISSRFPCASLQWRYASGMI